MLSIEDYENQLRKNNLKVTKSRLAVGHILIKNTEAFLSPDEIHASIQSLKGYSCDRVSVYRVLASLEKIGLLKVSHFQGQASKYQMHFHNDSCSHHCDDEHQHYFKCRSCNVVEPIGDCFADKKVAELMKQGYKDLTHHFEISGLCPSCC